MRSIILDYIKYVQNFMFEYYRILLEKEYDRKIVAPFIQKYIDVRYYANSVYEKENNFIEKINKELKLVADNLFEEYPKKTDIIKDIFALFGYILYIDDCLECKSMNKLINSLYEDTNIHMQFDINKKEEFTNMVSDYNENKKRFWNLFDSQEFSLKLRRLRKNLYLASLEQNCKLSSIYSDEAIDKAYNSEVVNENKIYLLLLLLNSKILENICKLDYSKNYVVDYPISLFDKNKKSNKFFTLLDNTISMEKISLRFTYKDYLDNKTYINNLVKEGYSVSLVLDESFDEDYNNLILFSNIFVYEKYEYFDKIEEISDSLGCNVITI